MIACGRERTFCARGGLRYSCPLSTQSGPNHEPFGQHENGNSHEVECGTGGRSDSGCALRAAVWVCLRAQLPDVTSSITGTKDRARNPSKQPWRGRLLLRGRGVQATSALGGWSTRWYRGWTDTQVQQVTAFDPAGTLHGRCASRGKRSQTSATIVAAYRSNCSSDLARYHSTTEEECACLAALRTWSDLYATR